MPVTDADFADLTAAVAAIRTDVTSIQTQMATIAARLQTTLEAGQAQRRNILDLTDALTAARQRLRRLAEGVIEDENGAPVARVQPELPADALAGLEWLRGQRAKMDNGGRRRAR